MSKTEAKKTEAKMVALTAKIALAREYGQYEVAARLEADLAALYEARWA